MFIYRTTAPTLKLAGILDIAKLIRRLQTSDPDLNEPHCTSNINQTPRLNLALTERWRYAAH